MAKSATGALAPATEIKVVGKSGQISLGKRLAGKTLSLDRLDDGRIVLTAVAMVPESQLWTLDEPHRSQIAKGLTWASQAAPAATDVDRLLKKASAASGRSRGKRR